MKMEILAAAAASSVLCGCMTEQMKSTPFYEGHDVKYTGRPEDRVNLWPLAYWREPVGSVLWPVFSFSDDHFAFRPLYSRYGSEHNFLWPIGQYDSARGEGRFFPVCWGKNYFDIFPLVWNHRDFHSLFPLFFYEEEDYMTLFPVVWWDIDEKGFTLFPVFGHSPERDWLFPLFYHDRDVTLVTPLFGANKEGASWLLPLYWHDSDVTWISPLFGMNRHGDSWLIPFYASVDGDFVSPLWCGGGSGAGTDDKSSWWLAPPLLSWGSEVKGVRDDRYLLGLGGYSGGEESSRSWLMPFYYGDSEGTFVTPLYGQTKDSQWTFPLWYRDNDSFASWFWGGHWNDKDELDWWIVPPLLTSGGRDENGARFSVLTVLGGARWDGPDGFRSSWCLPLWYENSRGTLVTPLYGQYDGCRWLAPLFYKDKSDFVTPLWWQSFDAGTGDTESWMIPPLLTGGGRNGDGSTYFYSPIGGYSGEKSGIFPLWYRDEDSFASIPFCTWHNEWYTTYLVPPLLSWYTSHHKYGSGSETRLLLGLYGHDTDHDGKASSDWLFPLYSWRAWDDWKLLLGVAGTKGDGSNWLLPLYGYDGHNGDLQTILFGRESHHSSTNYWWLTPLVGSTTGSESAFWFQPFVHWSRDNNIGDLERMMNADRLGDSIAGKTRAEPSWNSKERQFVTNDVFRTDSAYTSEKLRFCLDIMGRTRRICCDGGDNEKRYGQWRRDEVRNAAGKLWREGKSRTVSFDESVEFGNSLVFGGESQRVVNFDYDTKEKVFDGELDESRALFGLVWSSRDERVAGGHEYSKRALFWRLWHYEELNGDSTTDIFPFITYDSKKNGYRKTSFLWRLFRYENDPEKGKKVDFLFIPVWR